MKAQTHALPNLALRRERERRHWTQSELALKISATYLTVCRWENGATSPSLYYRKQLCDVFGLPPEALGLTPPAAAIAETTPGGQPSASAVPAVWQVPFRRNPFFTGREAVLARLAALLFAGKAAALSQTQALSGLGGIGKTQTAVEYAYRHRQDYHAVFWARAETRETLHADLVSIAELLCLPERQEQEQSRIITAVKRWLSSHEKWLLILDNIEQIALVEEIIPSLARGHLLLTTRTQSTGGIARLLDLEEMSSAEGALFLLRRASLLPPDAPLEASAHAQIAQDIAQLLAGLPLALDQAGAYIEETGCSPADYLERYQRYQTTLLQRRGRAREHPQSVSTTVALAFQNVQRASPAAADLLRLCAFLAPDAIPEELITEGAVEREVRGAAENAEAQPRQAPAPEGAPELGETLAPVAADPLALDEVYAVLRRASLVRRHAESKTLTIHRLVQAVLKDSMDEAARRQWAERAVRAVRRAFPEGTSEGWGLEQWPRCERLISHALVCAALIDQCSFRFPEAAHLLRQAGWYQHQRGQYPPAEHFLRQALALYEQLAESDPLDTALTLNNLATVSWEQGRYDLAEQFCRRALTIREQILGPDHPNTAAGYNNLGILAWSQGHYAEAAAMYQRAVTIWEQTLSPDHPWLADARSNLATAYLYLGNYQQAEPLFQQALAIREQQLGPEHVDITPHLNNLGELYQAQGRYEEAERLFRRGLAIREQALGADHPSIAYSLNNLADLYQAQGRLQQAEPLFQRALAIRERALGPDHQLTARTLYGLAQLAEYRQQYAQALSLYQRALTIDEQALGPDHPDTTVVRERCTRLQAQIEQSGETPGEKGAPQDRDAACSYDCSGSSDP